MQENQNRPSKRTYTVHRVRRTVRALLGPKKKDTTLEREKDAAYFGHIWVDKETYETLRFLAQVNHMNLKETLRQVVRVGLSQIFSQEIMESNRQEAAMREQGLPPGPTPFVRELIKWARSAGYDIQKAF